MREACLELKHDHNPAAERLQLTPDTSTPPGGGEGVGPTFWNSVLQRFDLGFLNLRNSKNANQEQCRVDVCGVVLYCPVSVRRGSRIRNAHFAGEQFTNGVSVNILSVYLRGFLRT